MSCLFIPNTKNKWSWCKGFSFEGFVVPQSSDQWVITDSPWDHMNICTNVMLVEIFLFALYSAIGQTHTTHQQWHITGKVNTKLSSNQTVEAIRVVFPTLPTFKRQHSYVSFKQNITKACYFSLQCLFQMWPWRQTQPTWWSLITQPFSCAPFWLARCHLTLGWTAALWSQPVGK